MSKWHGGKGSSVKPYDKEKFNENFDKIFGNKKREIKKMPTKLKASQKVRSKTTGKTTTEHFYLKTITVKELEECVNASNTKPKVKLKCIRELIRRNK